VDSFDSAHGTLEIISNTWGITDGRTAGISILRWPHYNIQTMHWKFWISNQLTAERLLPQTATKVIKILYEVWGKSEPKYFNAHNESKALTQSNH